MIIQSFYYSHPGKQSNNAQSCPFPHHTFGTFRREGGSHPGVSPKVSPGSCHPAPPREREMMHERRVHREHAGCTQGSILGYIPGYSMTTRGSVVGISGSLPPPYHTHQGTMRLMLSLLPRVGYVHHAMPGYPPWWAGSMRLMVCMSPMVGR